MVVFFMFFPFLLLEGVIISTVVGENINIFLSYFSLILFIDSLWSDVNSEMCQLGSVSNPSKQAAVVSSNPIGNIESLGADHEYHEISDEENQDSPLRFDKTLNFDFGPSLLAEMDQMFRSLGKRSIRTLDTSNDHNNNDANKKLAV